jgi:hypothetical protein
MTRCGDRTYGSGAGAMVGQRGWQRAEGAIFHADPADQNS